MEEGGAHEDDSLGVAEPAPCLAVLVVTVRLVLFIEQQRLRSIVGRNVNTAALAAGSVW